MGRYLSGDNRVSVAITDGESNNPVVGATLGYLGVFGSGTVKVYRDTDLFIVPPGVLSIRIRVIGGGGIPFSMTVDADNGVDIIVGGMGAGYAHGVYPVLPGDAFLVAIPKSDKFSIISDLSMLQFSGGLGGTDIEYFYQTIDSSDVTRVLCTQISDGSPEFNSSPGHGTTVLHPAPLISAFHGKTGTGSEFVFNRGANTRVVDIVEYLKQFRGYGEGGDFTAFGGLGGISMPDDMESGLPWDHYVAGGGSGSQLGNGGMGGAGRYGAGGGAVGGGNGGPRPTGGDTIEEVIKIVESDPYPGAPPIDGIPLKVNFPFERFGAEIHSTGRPYGPGCGGLTVYIAPGDTTNPDPIDPGTGGGEAPRGSAPKVPSSFYYRGAYGGGGQIGGRGLVIIEY